MPMTMESSEKLASLIARIADGVTMDVEKSKGTSYKVTITYKGNALVFKFDHGGRRPTAVDAISALWGRASCLARGEDGFYEAFYEKAYEAFTDGSVPLDPEYVAHYEEWKHCAEDSWHIFGDWFGRKWE